jgi:hypothetical protein
VKVIIKCRFDGRSLYECEADSLLAALQQAVKSWADLYGANLSRANLSGADLSWANLSRANLYGAKVSETHLDPERAPNAEVSEFEQQDGYVIGYRTRNAGHIDKYRDGRVYSADWFSTADTECHPGLYLWPSLKHAQNYSGPVEFIRVRTKPADVHKAGGKWRCRWFEVIGEAK